MISKEAFLKRVDSYLKYDLSKSYDKQKLLLQDLKNHQKKMISYGVVFGLLSTTACGDFFLICLPFIAISCFFLKRHFKQFITIKKELNKEKNALFAFCLNLLDLEPDNLKFNKRFVKKSNLNICGVFEDGFKGKGKFEKFYISECYDVSDEGKIKYKLLFSIPYFSVKNKTIVYDSFFFQKPVLEGGLKEVSLDLDENWLNKNFVATDNEDEAKRFVTSDFVEKIDKTKEVFRFLTSGYKNPRIDASFFDKQLLLLIESEINLFEFFDVNTVDIAPQDKNELSFALFYDTVEAIKKTVYLFER